MINRLFGIMLAKVVFGVLGRGMKGVFEIDPDMKVLVEGLPEDYIIKFAVEGTDANMVFSKQLGVLKVYKAKDSPDKADLTVMFKNIATAVPVLVGKKSTAMAYAECDFILKGDIYYAMNAVEMVNLTEAYLLPSFIINKMHDKPLKRRRSKLRFFTYFCMGV